MDVNVSARIGSAVLLIAASLVCNAVWAQGFCNVYRSARSGSGAHVESNSRDRSCHARAS